MIAISLVAAALSALSASAFRPPAFCVGRVTAASAKTTVVAYVDNNNSKEERIAELESRLKDSEAKNLDLQFRMMSDKIDHVDRKIDDVKMGLDRKIDDVKMGLDRKIDDVKMGLDRKIDDIAKDVKTVSKDLSTVKTGLVVIACLCVAPQLSAILDLFK
jgi:TolA-binding protein